MNSYHCPLNALLLESPHNYSSATSSAHELIVQNLEPRRSRPQHWLAVALIMLSALGCRESSEVSPQGSTPFRNQSLVEASLMEGDGLIQDVNKDFKFRHREISSEPLRFELTLEDAPPYVHALEMAPRAKEPKLDSGTWMVLTYAIFSVPDQKCIGVAVRGTGRYGGCVQLGLRPYLDYDEIKNWYPHYDGRPVHPLWLILKDGKVQREQEGPLSEDDVVKFIGGSLRGE